MVVDNVGGVKGSGCGGRGMRIGRWPWSWGKVIGGGIYVSWDGGEDFSDGSESDIVDDFDFLVFRDINTPRTRRREPPMNTYGRSRPRRLEEAIVSERTGILNLGGKRRLVVWKGEGSTKWAGGEAYVDSRSLVR
jgi:hypothetical protein